MVLYSPPGKSFKKERKINRIKTAEKSSKIRAVSLLNFQPKQPSLHIVGRLSLHHQAQPCSGLHNYEDKKNGGKKNNS